MDQTSFRSLNKGINEKVTTVDSDLFFSSLFKYNPDMVLFMDTLGIIAKVNDGFSEALGYPASEIELSPLERFISPEEIANYKEVFQIALTGKTQYVYTTFLHKDGETLNVVLHLIPAKSEDRVIGVFGIAKDITVMKNKEIELEESELKFSSIADDAVVGIYIAEENGTVSYGNKKLYELLGIENQTAPINLLDFVHPEDLPELKQVGDKLLSGTKGVIHDYRILRKDGTIVEVEAHSTVIYLNQKPHAVGTLLDITELKKAVKLNEYLANHDDLTNLPNQRFFYKILEDELMTSERKQQALTVMFLDLDRFKYVNDTLGHMIGDKLLKEVSNRLKRHVHEKGMIARLGGDEFAILFPNLGWDTNEVAKQAKSLIQLMEESFYIEQFDISITASIGISMYPMDAKDGETLMKHADSALYKAKARGKNTYQIFISSMDAETYKIFTLEADLRKAIDFNQFELHYQPKINTQTYEIVGAEALIRWNHPEWGLVHPKEFIQIAEETGLIIEIGKWIKEKVCKQIRNWQDAGLPPIPVSINLSPSRFLEKDLIKNIENILKETNLNPKYLQLEIVETSLLENENIIFNILSDLKKMGIKVSLDDFGTGYSSLSYLKKYTGLIDTLKIDRSFINSLSWTNPDSTNFLTRTIINLARHFKMDVVAEGVETNEQLSLLKEFQCQKVQGFLFSGPIPADEFELLLKDGIIRPKADDEPIQPVKERRMYFRIPFEHPLMATMTLEKVHGRKVNLGKSEVLIENMGLGGLRFLSDLKLPVSREIVLEFQTTILGQKIHVYGYVVWKKELINDIYQYGIEFILDENERMDLAQILNKLAIELKNNKFVPDCSFINISPYNFFKYKKSYQN